MALTGRFAPRAAAWGDRWMHTNGYRPCFVAGTPLKDSPHTSKPIEQFRVGDLLLSKNDADPNAPVEYKRVVGTLVRVSPIVNLHVGGEIIGTTGEHPFYVKGRGWLATAFIEIGDEIQTSGGEWMRVEGVAQSGRVQTVYNLEVEDYHTYFVGAAHWGWDLWSHNHNQDIPEVTRTIPDDRLRRPRARGRAPIGEDGHPVELHHIDQTLGNASPRAELTRTDHRGPGNYSNNHSNTGQRPSTVDRRQSSSQHRAYWDQEWDNGRFEGMPE